MVRRTANTYSSQNGGISTSNRENLKIPDWRFKEEENVLETELFLSDGVTII